MGKPAARLVSKNKDTGEYFELGAGWESDFQPKSGDRAYNVRLTSQTRDGEPVEVRIQYRVAGKTVETIKLGKEGTHYLNLYVRGEDSPQADDADFA